MIISDFQENKRARERLAPFFPCVMFYSMRWAYATILLFGFLLVSLFGFTAMGQMDGRAHDGCIASFLNGAACPQNASANFNAVLFHANALKSFSMAVFGEHIMGTFFLWLFFLYSVWRAVFFAAPLLFSQAAAGRFQKLSPIPIRKELIRWLALHEESPAFS